MPVKDEIPIKEVIPIKGHANKGGIANKRGNTNKRSNTLQLLTPDTSDESGNIQFHRLKPTRKVQR